MKPEKEQKALGEDGASHLTRSSLTSGLNHCLTTTGTNTWVEMRKRVVRKGQRGMSPGDGRRTGKEEKGWPQTDHGRPFIQGLIRIRHIACTVFAETDIVELSMVLLRLYQN